MVQNQRLKAGLQQAQAGQAELRRQEDAFRRRVAGFEENAKAQAPAKQQPAEIAGTKAPANQQPAVIAELEMPPVRELTYPVWPGAERRTGEPQKALVIPPTATQVHLHLRLDADEYKTYEALLLPVGEKKEILRGKALRCQTIDGNAVVVWTLPAQSIPSGDYIVYLSGQVGPESLEDVASYSFRVLRK
jgi:hypothetical protein